MPVNRLELKVPPVVLVAAGVGVIWLISRTLVHLTVIPDYARDPVVAGLVILGVILVGAGTAQFFRARTTVDPHRANRASSLVTGGIYRITRNPMYLGMLLFLIAMAMRSGNVATFIVVPGFIAYMNRFQIQPEERVLTELFGEEYRHFATRTRRWI